MIGVDMIIRSKWAQKHYEKFKNNPEYITEGMMLVITDQICGRMKELNISQTELGKRLGNKSQAYVSKLLNHESNVTLRTLAKIALALDMQIEAPKFKPKPDSTSNPAFLKAIYQSKKSAGGFDCFEVFDKHKEVNNDTVKDAA